MNETSLTVCGNVCTNPRHVVRDDGLMITSFRIASTIRKYDRDRRQWVDGETTFLTVSCFRALAANVAVSVEKGQRVLVTGRLRVKPWTKGDRSGTSVEIEAWSVGHDLAWGTAAFTRVARVDRIEQPGRAEADELALAGVLEHERDELLEHGRDSAMDRELRQLGRPGPQNESDDDQRVDELVPAAATG